MVYEQMISESQNLGKQIESIHSQLSHYPDGKLICTRNGTHYKWYHSNHSTSTYIPKKKRDFAEQLARKKYLSLLLKELIQEKKAVDSYLELHSNEPPECEKLLLDTSAFQELLTPYFQPASQELTDWANAIYTHNEKYPEKLIFKTNSGHMVRSKSEAMIDMLLYVNKIPFRYECALELSNTTIFPDFIIRHPQTGNFFYWEHFGMMDDPKYCHHACSKIELYAANKIYPSINLITTYETQENPLNPDTVQKIIEHYFL